MIASPLLGPLRLGTQGTPVATSDLCRLGDLHSCPPAGITADLFTVCAAPHRLPDRISPKIEKAAAISQRTGARESRRLMTPPNLNPTETLPLSKSVCHIETR